MPFGKKKKDEKKKEADNPPTYQVQGGNYQPYGASSQPNQAYPPAPPYNEAPPPYSMAAQQQYGQPPNAAHQQYGLPPNAAHRQYGLPPNAYARPHAYNGQQVYGAHPPVQPGQTLVMQGGFDAGARFDMSSASIPPPPPGYSPNAAQFAASQGQNVVVSQRPNDWFTGGSDGGYVIW